MESIPNPLAGVGADALATAVVIASFIQTGFAIYFLGADTEYKYTKRQRVNWDHHSDHIEYDSYTHKGNWSLVSGLTGLVCLGYALSCAAGARLKNLDMIKVVLLARCVLSVMAIFVCFMIAAGSGSASMAISLMYVAFALCGMPEGFLLYGFLESLRIQLYGDPREVILSQGAPSMQSYSQQPASATWADPQMSRPMSDFGMDSRMQQQQYQQQQQQQMPQSSGDFGLGTGGGVGMAPASAFTGDFGTSAVGGYGQSGGDFGLGVGRSAMGLGPASGPPVGGVFGGGMGGGRGGGAPIGDFGL